LRLFVLQLIKHKEGAPRAAQGREAREDVGRRARSDRLVEPDAARDDVDAAEHASRAELGEGRGVRGLRVNLGLA